MSTVDIEKPGMEESEKSYSLFMMQSPFAFAIFKGRNMVISLANDQMKLVLGKGEAIEGKPLLEVLPELVGQPFPGYLDSVYHTGIPFNANESLAKLHRNGRLEDAYFNFVYQPFRENDNSISGITCIAYEVTSEVVAKKLIAESENRYRELSTLLEEKVKQRTQELFSQKDLSDTIINTSTDLIGVYDTEMRIISFNKACEDIFNVRKEDVIGKKYLDLWPQAENGQAHKDLLRALNGELIRNDIYYSELAKRYYQNSLTPLKNNDGKVYAVVVIGHDITDIILSTEKIKQSEEKFTRLFIASPLGMTLTELPTGKLVDVNEVQLQTVGYSREEYLGRTSLELNLVDKNDRDKIMDALSKNGSVRNIEVEITTKSGEKIPVLNSIETITIGNKQYYLSAIIDISDRKKSERKISEANKELKKINEELLLANEEVIEGRERYQRMIKEVKDYAIIYLSKNGIIEDWNEGAEKIKGYSSEEIIGKSFSIFYGTVDRENGLPQKLLNEARTKGKATHEGWRVRKDGTTFWGSILITALHNGDGQVVGFSKVTRDLTDRKNGEDKLREASEELKRKNEALLKMNKELESFTYISSHDLQEPLRKIKTFAGRIVEKEIHNLSETGKDYFNRMSSAADRMQTLIQDLLTFSRLNTTERVFELSDLKKIVEEVKREYRDQIREKQAAVTIGDFPEIKIIPFQFRQLISNLLNNSLKYSKPGIPSQIDITSEQVSVGHKNSIPDLAEGKYCHIIFKDNGIGFEPRFNEKIFEVFQKLHGKDEYPGTGIGLAIVKKIIENHKGLITANGEPGEGATFDIYLPA